MKKQIFRSLTAVPILVLVFSFLVQSSVYAAFVKSNIMSDSVFSDADAMNASQINKFLNSFSQSCISTNRGFLAIDPTGYSPSAGFKYGGYVSAGTVIYHAAQAYDINPRVLLATLEKEQSLVTGRNNFSGYCNNGDEHKYAAAVGYGCPDSGTRHSYTGVSLYKRNGAVHSKTGTTCVSSKSKAGFTQQVIRAAWLFKFGQQRSLGHINWAVIKGSWDNSDDLQSCYGGPMTRGTYQRCPSGGSAYYDGYYSIDSQSVYIGTGATAALYWYTPHFSGNTNFVNIYERWFGSTRSNPINVSVSDAVSTENGNTAKVKFSLAVAPTSNVTIPLSVSDTSEASLGGVTSVTITPANWNDSSAHIITITGLNDTEADGDIAYLLVTGNPTSSDPAYGNLDGADAPNARLFNLDNEPDTPLSGDWDGDGITEIGIKRGNVYMLDYNNNGKPDKVFRYGTWQDTPLVGDWDKDRRDEIGLKHGTTYFLNYENDGRSNYKFNYGIDSSDIPIVGDWNGDGRDTVGIKHGNTYFLNYDFDSSSDYRFKYGIDSTDIPITGDWDRNGKDSIGIKNGTTYFLNNNNDSRSSYMFNYGIDSSDEPLTGDWDKDRRDEVGIRNGNTFYLNYENDGRSNYRVDFSVTNSLSYFSY